MIILTVMHKRSYKNSQSEESVWNQSSHGSRSSDSRVTWRCMCHCGAVSLGKVL